jgi:hypothetical protein
MYIGTSLGRCLVSIMDGEVSESDVVCIICRTEAPNLDMFLRVVTSYYRQGNPYSRVSSDYEFEPDTDLVQVLILAERLWHNGKIHQPRLFGVHGGYIHPVLAQGVWLEVVPPATLTNDSVRAAYEQYKIVAGLAQDHSLEI